ncbi:isopenicillin N synthase family dioxygenase [Spartinivicinus poritis]|uniref:Isopenicillin N synthase family oxygenase n=1 Tax=Spartinivicinus poritis TaxID=2994640 RepID=A0ABT5UD01_9GAMM|nr:2-oxoglutarate and iron-dependent oxygenase domain-containing protein [Spartinivicinus sp. A2-2]MDE1464254.1 isopenicillin N synthase family oxygenase [Spartinivicinus sp. A2-2]
MSVTVEDSLQSKTTSFNEIPIVDIAPLLDQSNPMKVVQEIGYICEHIGFLYIKNHGVDEQLIKEAYKLAEVFFALPFEEKNKLNITHSGQTLRGYIPMYAENVDPENTRDFKECFDFGQETSEVSPFFGPNLMPQQPERFKAVFEQYRNAMLDLARQLIRAIALSLGLPADYFAKLQTKPITIQRLLHYPPQQGEITMKEFGIGAHTDYGFLTILSQDANGGLQVQNRNGDWVSAPPVDGTLIVNIGDLVQTFTNDRYISTLHRVINISGKERYSLPFFIDLDYDAKVEVVPTCRDTATSVKNQSYTCGQHKYKRFVDSYTHLQTTLRE